MGSGGAGPFDNDEATDGHLELVESDDPSLVEEVLDTEENKDAWLSYIGDLHGRIEKAMQG